MERLRKRAQRLVIVGDARMPDATRDAAMLQRLDLIERTVADLLPPAAGAAFKAEADTHKVAAKVL